VSRLSSGKVNDSQAAERFRIALDMHELGVQMQRARIRRLRPGATAAEIEEEVSAWLRADRGPSGDAAWRPSRRFE
jgi:hypothetical protein